MKKSLLYLVMPFILASCAKEPLRPNLKPFKNEHGINKIALFPENNQTDTIATLPYNAKNIVQQGEDYFYTIYEGEKVNNYIIKSNEDGTYQKPKLLKD